MQAQLTDSKKKAELTNNTFLSNINHTGENNFATVSIDFMNSTIQGGNDEEMNFTQLFEKMEPQMKDAKLLVEADLRGMTLEQLQDKFRLMQSNYN